MDVGDPSNRPRVEALFGHDFGQLRKGLQSYAVNDDETLATMKDVYERLGYILCPHTAVGYAALKQVPQSSDQPKVLLATAHPAKFSSVVDTAIGLQPELPLSLSSLADLGEGTKIPISSSVSALKEFLLEGSNFRLD